jgi:hypothetical protein
MEHCQNSDCKHSCRACDEERKLGCEDNKKRKVRGGEADFDGVAKHEINTNRILDKKTKCQYGWEERREHEEQEQNKRTRTNGLFFSACLCYLPPFLKPYYFSFVLYPVEYFRHFLSYEGTWVYGMSFGIIHRASPAQKHASIVGFQEMPSHFPGYSIPVQI